MLKTLKQRRENDEQGFTLIELMVVVLIIAILLAIAIPTFLGAQNRAKDRATQSDLRNALTAAKTLATDQEGFFRKPATPPATGFVKLLPSDIKAAETSLSFVVDTDDAADATTDLVGVSVGGTTSADYGTDILLTKQSKASGNIFWGIKATKDGAVTYCKGDLISELVASCAAASFSAAVDATNP